MRRGERKLKKEQKAKERAENAEEKARIAAGRKKFREKKAQCAQQQSLQEHVILCVQVWKQSMPDWGKNPKKLHSEDV